MNASIIDCPLQNAGPTKTGYLLLFVSIWPPSRSLKFLREAVGLTWHPFSCNFRATYFFTTLPCDSTMDRSMSYSGASRGWSPTGKKVKGRMKPRSQSAPRLRAASEIDRQQAISPSTDSEGRIYLKRLKIIHSPRASFDAEDVSHPRAKATLPRKLKRPATAGASTSPGRHILSGMKSNPSPVRSPNSPWGLGRQFMCQTLNNKEREDALFAQWIHGYNDEKTRYRSASVQIDTSFSEALVFVEGLPLANKTIISVAFQNFDRVISVCGRYRRHLLTIRKYLIGAIYMDPANIPPYGKATIEKYASTPTYFGESFELTTELEIVKMELDQVREERNKEAAAASSHKKKGIGHMLMGAARRASFDASSAEMQKKLKKHDDHLHHLHTRTYDMIVNLLAKLTDAEIIDLGNACLTHFSPQHIIPTLLAMIEMNVAFNSEVAKTELVMKLTKGFLEPSMHDLVRGLLVRIGGKSRTTILLKILTSLPPAARQTVLVDMLSDTTDRSEVLSRLMQLIDETDKTKFVSFVVQSVFQTSTQRVQGCSQLLKAAVGLTPEDYELKAFAEDFVAATSTRGSHVLNAFQNAVLKELFDKCDYTNLRTMLREKRQASGHVEKVVKKKKGKKAAAIKQAEKSGAKTDLHDSSPPQKTGVEEHEVVVPQTATGDGNTKEGDNIKGEDNTKGGGHEQDSVDKTKKLNDAALQDIETVDGGADDDDLDSLASDFEEQQRKAKMSRTIATQTMGSNLSEEISSESPRRAAKTQAEQVSRMIKEMRPFAQIASFKNKDARPLSFHKTLALIYETYANKIVADATADRAKLRRESLGNFIARMFKNQFGLEKQVKNMLSGLIESLNKFKARSKRIVQFTELVGVDESHEYSEKTCDIYLSLLRSMFPKFSKATLMKSVEGSTFIPLSKARKAAHYCFPLKKSLKFQIGRMKLRQDIHDELFETLTRIAKPKVNFDVMMDCCIEATDRQFAINNDTLKLMFEHHKTEDHENLTRADFNNLIQTCVEGIREDELDEIWEESHHYKVGKFDPDTLNPEIFSHVCTLYGIAPPVDWIAPMEVSGVTELASVDSNSRNSLGVLMAGFKLKSMSRKVKEKLKIPPISRLCQVGNIAEIERLLEEEADINEVDHRGTSPLMHAAWWGYFDVVKILVEAGADINARNHRWNTALHFAYEEKRTDIVKYLESHGAASMENKIGLRPEDFLKELKIEEDAADDECED
jgi:ankyrin repeat protein